MSKEIRILSIQKNVISVLTILYVIIVSCSNQQQQSFGGKPIQPVKVIKLNWIGHWKNEGFKEQLVYEVARQFEFENQDISLNLKFPEDAYPGVPEPQFIFGQITQPQSTWDILRINNETSGVTSICGDPTWPAKYLVDFSQMEKFRQNSIDVVTSDAMKKRWGGIIPGHALDGHSFVLWANKKVAEKLGITLKPFGITFSDLESYFRAVNTYNQINKTHIRAISLNTGGWTPCSTFAEQLFASIIGDYDKLKNKNYSEEKLNAWAEVLKNCEKLSLYHPVDPNWRNNKYGTDYAKSLQGDYLFTINGTWMYNIWKKMDSVRYRDMIPLELPAINPASTYLGEVSIPWVVPKNSPHREEASRLMLYWCRPEIADKWVRYTKSPTGVKGSLVQSEFGFDVYETFDYTISKKYANKKLPLTYGDNSIYFGEKNARIPNYFEEVLEGSVSASEAMRNIYKRIVKN